ncbi:MAG: YIP1 family protein [Candidatus Sericytochromatia bacterium]|nr:YIP1 family protein [Candidatus Tanganyikabacteria bacterium]
MLESLYRSLCRPGDAPIELEPGTVVGIWGLLAVALAFVAAGKIGVGGFGAFGIALLLLGAFLANWFWAGAGLSLLARLAGGRGTAESTLGALAQAAWPLLLLPPVVALADRNLFPGADALVTAIAIWALVLGVAFLRRVHGLSWGKAVLAWITLGAVTVMTGLVGVLAGGILTAMLIG